MESWASFSLFSLVPGAGDVASLACQPGRRRASRKQENVGKHHQSLITVRTCKHERFAFPVMEFRLGSSRMTLL